MAKEESVPQLPKEVRIKNQTTWRTSDLGRVFEEARRWFRESRDSQRFRDDMIYLDSQAPDEMVFRSASAATSQYYVERDEFWYDLFDEKETKRGKKLRWTMYLPANRIVATEMLRVLDTCFGSDSAENLRTIVQRLRRLAGGKALTDQAFIIQHKNRKKRVYHGRRIRTAG